MAELNLKWDNGNPYAPKVYVDVWEDSQDAASNTTSLVYRMYIERPSNVTSASAKAYSIYINGDEVSSGTTTIGGQGTKWIVENTWKTISHNPDGTKSVDVSFSLELDINWGGTFLKTATASGTLDLTTIPRRSTIDYVYIQYLGENCEVSINRSSTEFLHKVSYKVGDSAWIVGQSDAATLASFPVPVDLARFSPNTNYAPLSISVQTYSNNGDVGEPVVGNYHVYVPEAEETKPSFGARFYPAHALPTEFNSVYIQGISATYVEFESVQAKLGASIRRYSLESNGEIGSGTSPAVQSTVFQRSGETTVTAVVEDSRGIKSRFDKTINILPYQKVNIDSFSVRRARKTDSGYVPDVTGNSAEIILHTTASSLVIGGTERNTKTVTLYKKKKADSGYGAGQEVQDGIFYVDNIEPNIAYKFKVEVKDTIGTVYSMERDVPTATVGMDIPNGVPSVSFGKYSEHQNALEIPSTWQFMQGEKRMADFVIEEGLQNGWTYRKWASGKAECWKDIETITSCTGSFGVLFETTDSIVSQETYPFIFAENPKEIVTIKTAVANGEYFGFLLESFKPNSTTNTGSYFGVRGSSKNTSINFTASVYVSGKLL